MEAAREHREEPGHDLPRGQRGGPGPLAAFRARRLEAELEGLRPLGVAYLMRRFGGSLDRADAEDAVAEVIVRLHRQATSGRRPANLRAAFFTAARNAAIDQLRARGARPTVPLEAVAEAPSAAPDPEAVAEAGDELARLREAMARMRPNYREAIALRFGLGLTVPEIAERQGISLPAAKKLVLRSTNQIRERMEAIGARRLCPEIRAAAARSLAGPEARGDAAEQAALRAHLSHCGPCRTFLAALRSGLHELGAGALLAAPAGHAALPHLAALAGHAAALAHGALARLRLLAFRAAGHLRAEDPGAGPALLSGGQKIAAACTAGAATAGCVATGLLGPGIAPLAGGHHPPAPPQHHRQGAHRRADQGAPPEPRPAPAATAAPPPPAATAPQAGAAPAPRGAPGHRRAAKKRQEAASPPEPAPQPEPDPAARTGEEFGFEPGAEAEAEAQPPAQAEPGTAYEAQAQPSGAAEAAPPPPSSSSGGSGAASAGGSSGGGTEHFGFGG
jgi:RNA polymerase sigma factor (sigma-70 family)